MSAAAGKRIVPAARTKGIKYAIRDILCIADEAKAAGRDMLYLNIGDPNLFGFAPPRHMIEDAARPSGRASQTFSMHTFAAGAAKRSTWG